MISQWRTIALGALSGAAIAVAIVFGAALTGNFPGAGDRQIRAYLLSHPQLVAQMSDKYQQEQDDADDRARQAAIDRLGVARFFDPKIAFVTGPVTARSTFVEFFDYNCPHCRNSVTTVQKFYNAHKGDTRFAFIEFPIQGPQSIVAARAALAARRQPDKYLPFHFAMMNEEGMVDENTVLDDARKVGLDVPKLKADMEDPAIAKTVEMALKLAHGAHVNGTPEFIVDGKSREGEVDDALLKQLTKG
jgi:protein-disulfide isomerase